MPLSPYDIHAIRSAVEIAGTGDATLAETLLSHSDVAAAVVNAVATAPQVTHDELAALTTVVRWFAAAGQPWAASMLSMATPLLVASIDDIIHRLTPVNPAAEPAPTVPPAVGPILGETYGDFKNRTQGAPILGPDGQEISAGLHYDCVAWI